jgi:hypothetical protein
MYITTSESKINKKNSLLLGSADDIKQEPIVTSQMREWKNPDPEFVNDLRSPGIDA